MRTKNADIVLFDDECRKCVRWTKFIQRRDPESKVKLVGQNSDVGLEVLRDIPTKLEGIDSIFFISSSGQWYSKSAAIWRVCRKLRFPWSLVTVVMFVPWPIRDYFYDVYARMRK